jgi:hypothetical protein
MAATACVDAKDCPVTQAYCDAQHKTFTRIMAVFMSMVVVCITFAAYSFQVAGTASDSAAEASGKSIDVQHLLSVHEARQNGSLDRIDARLTDLSAYHTELHDEMREQRKLLDELLRQSGNNP